MSPQEPLRNVSDLTPPAHQDLAEKLGKIGAQFTNPPRLTVKQVGALLTETIALMFPHFRDGSSTPTARHIHRSEALARSLISEVIHDDDHVDTLVADYLGRLPAIAELAMLDAKALYEFDPAAESVDEVILAYPGWRATVAYRLANALWHDKVPTLPRLITEYAHRKTGIDIHPGATIGARFCMDHGTAIVIGETAHIGDNVKLYQGVTLGGLSVKKSRRGTKRHPTLEDNVTVYAGATILGGQTIVGHDSVIGGNVWLTRSVAPFSRVLFKACDTEEILATDGAFI